LEIKVRKNGKKGRKQDKAENTKEMASTMKSVHAPRHHDQKPGHLKRFSGLSKSM
jgi:hypothetical protein